MNQNLKLIRGIHLSIIIIFGIISIPLLILTTDKFGAIEFTALFFVSFFLPLLGITYLLKKGYEKVIAIRNGFFYGGIISIIYNFIELKIIDIPTGCSDSFCGIDNFFMGIVSLIYIISGVLIYLWIKARS